MPLLMWFTAAWALTPPADATRDLGTGPYLEHTVADLDDDGVRDVVWATAGELQLWRGTLGGAPVGQPLSFATTHPVAPGGSTRRADLNADGIDDVAYPVLNGSTVEVEMWQGAAVAPVLAPWPSPVSLYTVPRTGGGADVSGDGHEDLVVYEHVVPSAAGGPGAPVPLGLATPRYSQWFLPLGDTDGDGYDDLLATAPSSAYSTTYGGSVTAIVLLEGGPGGVTTPRWSYTTGHDTCGRATPADIDADRVDEIVVLCFDAVSGPTSMVLQVLDDLDGAGPTVRTSTSFNRTLSWHITLTAADDWDEDGADEVFLALGGDLVELPWDAVTGFELNAPTATRLAAPQGNLQAAYATTDDVTGDGRGDLVVMFASTGSSPSRQLAVWLGPPLPVDTADTGLVFGTATTAATAATADTADSTDTGTPPTPTAHTGLPTTGETAADSSADTASTSGSPGPNGTSNGTIDTHASTHDTRDVDKGCGCASDGPQGAAAMALPLLLVALRRRARREPGSEDRP